MVKNTMATRRKAGERTKLNKKLDTLAKTAAKERDDYTCQRCGKQERGSIMHGSHVYPVSSGNLLRWDIMNIKALCYGCHLQWWHLNPLEAAEWFNDKFPERAKYLQSKIDTHNAYTVKPKMSIQDLRDLVETFKD